MILSRRGNYGCEMQLWVDTVEKGVALIGEQ
jgi:hypothetical protein